MSKGKNKGNDKVSVNNVISYTRFANLRAEQMYEQDVGLRVAPEPNPANHKAPVYQLAFFKKLKELDKTITKNKYIKNSGIALAPPPPSSYSISHDAAEEEELSLQDMFEARMAFDARKEKEHEAIMEKVNSLQHRIANLRNSIDRLTQLQEEVKYSTKKPKSKGRGKTSTSKKK